MEQQEHSYTDVSIFFVPHGPLIVLFNETPKAEIVEVGNFVWSTCSQWALRMTKTWTLSILTNAL